MLFLAPKALLLTAAFLLGAPSASAQDAIRCPEAFAYLVPGASFDYEQTIRDLESIRDLLQQVQRAAPAPLEMHAGDFKPCSLAATYEAFAQQGQLLNQTDQRLYSANLIVANGGLCASACAINVFGPAVAGLEAAPFYNSINANAIQMIVEKYPSILRHYGEVANEDARYGAFPHLILKSMESHFEAKGLRLTDHFYPRTYELSDPDSISIVTALLGDGAGNGIQGAHSAHAMVLLKLDPYRKEVLMSDPNDPNRIIRAFYSQGLDGEITFPLHLNYGTSGPTYARVVRAQVLTKAPTE